MKRLLFIIYTHSMGGGAEKILTTVVNHLDPQKYEIDVLEYAQYGLKQEPLHANIHCLKPLVSMRRDSKIKRVLKNLQVFTYPGLLRRREKTYDLEISFNYQIPTFLLSRRTPAIAWIHGDVYDLTGHPYLLWKQRRAFQHVQRIVAISEHTKRSIQELFPELRDKIELICNGFDLDQLREDGRQPCPIPLKTPSVAFVGRLDENKNPLEVLEVIDRLRASGDLVNFYVLGQGELEPVLREEIARRGLEDRVFLLGYQMNPLPFMARMGAICMLSKSEGFPTVFAEAMALGVPFISSPVGGTEELSDGGRCGRIVQDADACAEAIRQVVLDPATHERMRQACLTHIQNYSLQRQIERIEALIDAVLAES